MRLCVTTNSNPCLFQLGTIGGNLMIKHQHNEFPSDIYLLLETVGAQVTISKNVFCIRDKTWNWYLNNTS